MHKIRYILPLFVAAAAFAQDWVITGNQTTDSRSVQGNMIYNANATVNVNGQYGNVRVVGGELQVASGVRGVYNTSYVLWLGNSADTNGVISGAGKNSSTFSFTGYSLSTFRDNSSPNPTNPLTIQDITLNFTGSYGYTGTAAQNGGLLRAGQIIVDSSVINMKEGALALHGRASIEGNAMQLKNGSELNFAQKLASGANYEAVVDVSEGALPRGQRVFELSGASKMTVGYSLDMAEFSINASGNSSVSGATITNIGDIKLDNSSFNVTNSAEITGDVTLVGSSTFHVETGGTINIAGKLTMDETSKEYSFTGGAYKFGTIATNSIETRNIYVSAEAFEGTLGDNITEDSSFFIGMDKSGKVYNTKANFTGDVIFNTSKLVIDGNSTFTSDSEIILANTEYNDGSSKDGSSNYIGTNATVSGSTIRINGGYIDGSVSANGGYQGDWDWNYTLALGVAGSSPQSANVVLGSKARINVVGSTENAGKNFTMAGSVTSNAAKGAIKSDANGGFYIRGGDGGMSTLTLNTTDAFAVGGAATQGESTFRVAVGVDLMLNINANNNLKQMIFDDVDATTRLTLNISEGKVFTIGALLNEGSGVLEVTLGDDLKYGQLRITDMDAVFANYKNQDQIAFKDQSGDDRVLDSNLFIRELADGGYTIYTVIPEPAAIAAALGALALLLASRRRRSK